MQLFKCSVVIASILALPVTSHGAVADVATSSKAGPALVNSTRTGQDPQNDAGHVDTAGVHVEQKVETATVNNTSYGSSMAAIRPAASRGVPPVVESGSRQTLDSLYHHH